MNIFIFMHAVALLFMCGAKGQPNLEIIVDRKVKEFGQNLQLFCKIDNCCPKDAGWTVDDALIFIDIKRFIQKIDPNSRYDATYGESGMTLVIKNFTISDLNKTYECTYDFYSVRKSLLYDDVFSKITPENEKRNDSPTIIGGVIGSVIGIPGGAIFLILLICCIKGRGKILVCCFKRKEKIQHPVDNTEMEPLQNTIHQDSGRPSFNTESHQVDEAAMEPLQHIDNQQDSDDRPCSNTEIKQVDEAAMKPLQHIDNQQDSDRPCFNRDIQQVDEAAMEPLQHIDNQQDSSRLSFNRESQQDEQDWSELFTKIAPEIVLDWKRVGRMLGIPNSKINIIDKDTSQSDEKAYSMLQQWRNIKGSSAASVKLIDCLNELNLRRVAQIVEKHFKIDDTKVEIKEVVDTDGWSKLFHRISIEISFTEWRSLGLYLGHENDTLNCIDQDNCDIKEKIFALLQQWLDRNGRSATKGHLVRALEEIENKRVAEIVEEFQLENNAIE